MSSLATAVSAITPPPAPGTINAINRLSTTLNKLVIDYQQATTPDQQLALLPTLQTTITLFETDVMPLLHFGANVQVAIAVIDAGLRIAANHFVTVASKTANQGIVASGARSGQIETLKRYLQTPKVKKR